MNSVADASEQILKRGRIGWIVLAGLGVSYGVGGDFSAWNFGLIKGGWGGMLIGVILSGVMWIALMLTLAADEGRSPASKLARDLGLAPSSARRLIGALVNAGVVSRIAHGRYAAGPALERLADHCGVRARLAGAPSFWPRFRRSSSASPGRATIAEGVPPRLCGVIKEAPHGV